MVLKRHNLHFETNGNFDDSLPPWYWDGGLHDACIISVEELVFPIDYRTDFCKRNQLILKINAKQAMFDRSVKEIRLFNYEIISEQISLAGRNCLWWIADRLSECECGYILEIDLLDLESDPEDFSVIIKFEKAEVDRKGRFA